MIKKESLNFFTRFYSYDYFKGAFIPLLKNIAGARGSSNIFFGETSEYLESQYWYIVIGISNFKILHLKNEVIFSERLLFELHKKR